MCHYMSHMLILWKKYKMGLLKLRPPKTKYHVIWDINILLNFLENMSTDCDMDV